MKFQSTTTFFVFASSLPVVFSQTWTTCNPLQKSCPADPALGTTYEWDFTQGASSKFTATGSKDIITYDSNGMTLPVKASGDSPTITSNFYIFGGKVEIVMKAAPGQGIVSSLVFESDDLDEIDYEWIGSEITQVQTNYFGKGDTSSYDRGGKTPVTNPSGQFHTYGIEWTKNSVIWSIDGTTIRTLVPSQVTADALHKDLYPQTPMQIKIGSWSGGDPGNSKGTIEWAGGETDYSKGPYPMVVKSIKIQDYSAGATSYTYGDQSGSWDSIVVAGGSGSSNPPSSSSAAPSSYVAPSSASASAPASSSAAQTTSPASTVKSSTVSGSAISTTLATSTRASPNAQPSKTSSSGTYSSSSPMPSDLSGLIVAGIPNSFGSYGPGDKGLNMSSSSTTLSSSSPSSTGTASKTSTGTSTPTANASGAPAATNAAPLHQVGLGGLLMGFVAAAALL